MIYSLMIQCSPTSPSLVSSSLKFAKALISANHSIYRIFFYGDGIQIANQNTVQPQDEADQHQEWRNFIDKHNLDAVICIAAALKRGVLDATEATRYSKTAVTAAPYELSGLGQLIDACVHSDRLISFA